VELIRLPVQLDRISNDDGDAQAGKQQAMVPPRPETLVFRIAGFAGV
jgi:hypothetical protein